MGIPLYYKNIIQDFPDIIIPDNDFNIEISNESVSIPNLLYQTILRLQHCLSPELKG